jgi:hypothetical protein
MPQLRTSEEDQLCKTSSKIDVRKLKHQLVLVRAKSHLAIILGDFRAVARLTCETARLTHAIRPAASVAL